MLRAAVADVELGVLLSGGIDSSMIVAMMQSLSDRPVKTFSIGFAEPEYNEADYAARVAEHLGTEHHELRLKADVLSRLDEGVELLDEPIADSAILPTFML